MKQNCQYVFLESFWPNGMVLQLTAPLLKTFAFKSKQQKLLVLELFVFMLFLNENHIFCAKIHKKCILIIKMITRMHENDALIDKYVHFMSYIILSLQNPLEF